MARFLSEKNILGLLLFALCIPLARQLLPILMPFGIGFTLAVVADPGVKWLHQKRGMPRSIATGIGVTGVFILSMAIFLLVTSLFLRQLRQVSGWLPEITDAITQGTSLLKQWMLTMSGKMPGSIRQVTEQAVSSMFDGGNGLLKTATGKLTQLAGNAIGTLSHGFVGMVTAILSAFMFSMRLPQLREKIQGKIPTTLRTAGRNFRKSLLHWILAQGKLAGVAFIFLFLGFLLLHIPKPLLWATLVTTVDFLPILGVGTVLIPWSIVCYIQGNGPKSLGLLGIFLLIWLVRSILEPKFIGKELGLDPLVTLACIYAGFRLWGLGGMLIAPIAAVCLVQLGRHVPLNADDSRT